jgi:hypothetical protein
MFFGKVFDAGACRCKLQGIIDRGRAMHIAGGAYVPTVFVGMYATQGRYNVQVARLTEVLRHEHLEPEEAR